MGSSDGGPEDGDLDRVAHRGSEEWKKAEALRKAEIFGRAAKAFRAFWDETCDPEAGWRYAHCLRKSGYHEMGLGLLFELEQEYPEHPEIRQELIWGIYEGRLLPAKQQGDSQATVQAAREMVAAEASGTALKLAVFAVMGAAKTKGQWRLVSNWCDLLDPAELSAEARSVAANGKIPSDRERWYFAKIKALLNLEEWHVAAEVTQSACADFPGNQDFVRWKANSWAGLGRLREAIELLESLRPRIAWYALADMARYSFELEDVEGAWNLATEAARAFGHDSAKVNLWELMARCALALGQTDVALHHIGLMEAVRREQGWPLRPSHLSLIDAVLAENGLGRLTEKPSRDWKSQCREHWGAPREVSLPSSFCPAGEQHQGKVVSWNPERSFAFILPQGGGEQVFVLAHELPEEARRNGVRVTYETIKHFDKRKNRESLRAVRVRLYRKDETRVEVPV